MKARYLVTIRDRQTGVSRSFESQALVEHHDKRMFFGTARVNDLRLDLRYVKELCVRRSNGVVAMGVRPERRSGAK